MPLPTLPASGSTSWYAWAQALQTLVNALETVQATKTTGVGITEIRAITQAAYDALGTKSSTTLYVISG